MPAGESQILDDLRDNPIRCRKNCNEPEPPSDDPDDIAKTEWFAICQSLANMKEMEETQGWVSTTIDNHQMQWNSQNSRIDTYMNNNIIEFIQTFAHRTDTDRVFDAEQAIMPSGEAAIPALIEVLKDPDTDLRIFALQVLEHIDQNTEYALPAMIEALTDPDRNVRMCALAPVASFGERAIDAVPILEKWIGSDDEFSHVSAAGHILMIDPTRSKELLSVLLKALESDDIGIRCQTAWLLGQLGELERDVVPALERMLDDENSSVRSVAADAILDITDNDITHVTI